MRLVGVAATLLLVPAVAWPCTPGPPPAYTLNGATARKLVLEVGAGQARLSDAKGLLWGLPASSERAIFGPGDSWVAFGPSSRGEGVTLVRTQKGAKPLAVEVLPQLTPRQRAKLPDSMCGPKWLHALMGESRGLRVEVSQQTATGPNTAPTHSSVPLLIGLDGSLRRLPLASLIDLAAAMAQWKGAATDEREDALDEVERQVADPATQKQRGLIPEFLDRVIATEDASAWELRTALGLALTLPEAELEPRARALVAREEVRARTLELVKPKFPRLALKLAAAVFEGNGSGEGRAAALQTLFANDGQKVSFPLISGLRDENIGVRRVALNRLNAIACSKQVAELMVRLLETGGAAPPHEQLPAGLLGCLTGPARPEVLPVVLQAVKGGLVLPPSAQTTTELYFELAVYAETIDRDQATELLRRARESLQLQPRRVSPEQNELDAWEVMRGFHYQEHEEARAALERLKVRHMESMPVCAFNPDLVGKVTSLARCKMSTVSKFVQTVEVQLLPQGPALSKALQTPTGWAGAVTAIHDRALKERVDLCNFKVSVPWMRRQTEVTYAWADKNGDLAYRIKDEKRPFGVKCKRR